MREFLKSTRFKVLLAFIAFLIGVMIYSVTKGGYAFSGASFINTVTKPLRTVSNGFSVKIETIIDRFENSDFYYTQNQELQKKIGELNKQLADYEDLKAEVEELRKLAVIKEEHPDSVFSQPAEVLGYIANDPFKSFTIDKGYADGIEPYSPVTTPEGIVGIVIEVSQYTATVRTILSPDLSVASVCSATNADFGIVEGTVITAENNKTKLTHLNINHEIKKDDLIITSGSSGLFPKDYPIGTVTKIGVEPNGLTAYAEIEPCTDISRLRSVFVITDFAGKKETEYEAENTP
ncbi:MAG: rod shape-determining protein MreC [Ruminococcus flavefaciens]|nr:rod shape-determining protein MreC [Ruminococcus flavefaciens]MCM1229033.1 rod shape-determining protein MreC [Ruminococcus flavefaciens]